MVGRRTALDPAEGLDALNEPTGVSPQQLDGIIRLLHRFRPPTLMLAIHIFLGPVGYVLV